MSTFDLQLLAELVGTYYLIFAGCAAIAVNAQHNHVVTLVGIAVVWGIVIMVLVYCLGHLSAHFNPAVTLALASSQRFPLNQVPAYITVQVIGSTLASATLRLLFDLNNDVCSKKHDVFLGSSPSGSDLQAFVMEFIITGFLMLVVCAVTTTKRTTEELEGLIIGATVTLNVIFAGEVSGASMNPARSIGPALVWGCYKGIWIYLLAPTLGAVSGALIHKMLPSIQNAEPEFSKTGSSHKRVTDLPL
ncbi:NOD26-like intrinsic protein 2;1 [Arabidopsis thaliana]|uniref:NOD26-like intrinsic protein 21 n=1 Tax=Arabidopsis thaliana TaxID=3702 RepID=A0A1P8AYX5_ARATH|nr:NOD26-like intrinsic protein 2;1 [Arabidopsis thaliana]ANM61822.1 NOD26-like intrinsic protein 2;1 [Arabidopsis thaliana]|eukprot:NP_001324019.1 NOD26-like intrinsic protein 2;1 [Arabidopsis thaliana]